MIRVVEVIGYDKSAIKRSLVTPRASLNVSVYGLSVDVFIFKNLLSRGLRSIS